VSLRYICRSDQLANGGDGIEFDVRIDDEVLPAFALRYQSVVYAYINRCSHMNLGLNFMHRNFFDLSTVNLICSTHGALYDPATGACRAGPCDGRGLQPLKTQELEGRVMLSPNSKVTLYMKEQ